MGHWACFEWFLISLMSGAPTPVYLSHLLIRTLRDLQTSTNTPYWPKSTWGNIKWAQSGICIKEMINQWERLRRTFWRWWWVWNGWFGCSVWWLYGWMHMGKVKEQRKLSWRWNRAAQAVYLALKSATCEMDYLLYDLYLLYFDVVDTNAHFHYLSKSNFEN